MLAKTAKSRYRGIVRSRFAMKMREYENFPGSGVGNTEEGRLKELNMGPLGVQLNTQRTANGTPQRFYGVRA